MPEARKAALRPRLRRRRLAAAVFVLAAAAGPAFAVQPDEVLTDAALEHRAREISAGLRCLVCQNQSIDDSDAPLAKDLRVLVRERLRAGESDTQVRDFLVRRYGEFVLLKPVFRLHTALLWLAPVLVFAAGGIGLVLTLRRRRPEPVAALSEAERAALEAHLDRDPAGS